MVSESSPIVTEQSLGAWVLKCNPAVWNIAAFVADGNVYVETWSVVENYRSAMMAHGQRAILWVQGDGKSGAAPGIWGVGYIAAGPKWRTEVEDPFYEDPQTALRRTYFVETQIDILAMQVSRETVRNHPALRDAEMFRSPQMGNPSFLTKEEFDAVLELLGGEWPEPPGGRKAGTSAPEFPAGREL